MRNTQQLEYCVNLELPRLQTYLSDLSEDEIISLAQDLKITINENNKISPLEKEKYLTCLAAVEASMNAKQQKSGKESDCIDISLFKPLTSIELTKILGLTIKQDHNNKLITFLGLLSAYTPDSQFNISFNAPSSSGKSYIPTELAKLFPKEDVLEIGYCSPTAFFHDKAKEYNKEINELVVDLSHKILIFLDQPHTLLLQHMRPILSHDKKEIHIKITDKSQKAGLRTKNIRLKGFPAVVFCTAGLEIDEQESTRFMLLSPEITQEKIREAIREKIKKSGNNFLYEYDLEMNETRQQLKKRIIAIKQETVSEIIIRQPEQIEQLFFRRVKVLKPRHQRDVGRIFSLIKVFALLNIWFREREGSAVIANDDDIQDAFQLWDAISESQELNLPPFVFELYEKVILTCYKEKNSDEGWKKIGITRPEILKKHFEVYGRHLSDWQLRKEIIPMLETSGLILQEEDPKDKRRLLISPTADSTDSSAQNNSGTESGVLEMETDDS